MGRNRRAIACTVAAAIVASVAWFVMQSDERASVASKREAAAAPGAVGNAAPALGSAPPTRVEAAAPGFAAQAARTGELPAITGIVTDPDSKPLADVRVSWRPSTAIVRTLGEVLTDASGAFSIAPTDVADLALGFEHPKYCVEGRSRVRPGARLEVTLRPGVAIEGVVRSALDGTPLRATLTLARAFFTPGDEVVVCTRADGTFKFVAPNRATSLKVEADGTLAHTWEPFDAASAPKPFEIRLGPVPRSDPLYVNVVDRDSRAPLRNVVITPGPFEESAPGLYVGRAARDEDANRIEVVAEGYGNSGHFLSVPAGATVNRPARVELVRASVVTARLVGDDGGHRIEQGSVRFGRVTPGRAATGFDGRGNADVNGVVRLESLVPDAHYLAYADARDFAAREFAFTTLAAGATLDLGQIELNRGIEFDVRVLDAVTREPVVGALVVAMYATGPGASEGSWITNAAGIITARGCPGRIDLAVVHDGYASFGRNDLDVTSGAAVDVALERGATLTGRVVDAAGQPVAGVPVRWTRKQSRRPRFDVRGFLISQKTVRTRSDGTYAIVGLTPGTYQGSVEVDLFRSPSVEVDVSADGPNVAPEFVLGARTAICGSVVDASTRQAVEWFLLRLLSETADVNRTIQNGNGRFFILVEPGAARRVSIDAPGYQSALLERVQLVAGEVRELQFALVPAAR